MPGVLNSLKSHWPEAVWRLALIVAACAAAGLVWEHVSGRSMYFCEVAGGGCLEAVNHPLSMILGVPAAVWSMAVYPLLWACPPSRWRCLSFRLTALLGSIILLAGSLFYLYIMYRDMVVPCPLCISVHISHLLLFVVVCRYFFVNRRGGVVADARPLSRVCSIPVSVLVSLLIPLLGYVLTVGISGTRSLTMPLSALEPMLSRSINPDYNNYFPSRSYEFVAGSRSAPYRLTIIGSLACRHCRRFLRGLADLPLRVKSNISITFIPFPLCSRCNPRADNSTALRVERCLLAARTLARQRAGKFWPWFRLVDEAPGRVQRRLLGTTKDYRIIKDSMTSLAGIPITAIPTLIWQGHILPPLTDMDARQLLTILLKIEAKIRRDTPPVDNCGSC